MQIKPYKFLLFSVTAFLLANCGEDPTVDEVVNVPKEGSVETSMEVEYLDSSKYEVLVTRHKVWVSNSLFKEIVHRDTIPQLGNTFETAYNENGDSKSVDMKKEYELYITVK
jgi:hypothetical protein